MFHKLQIQLTLLCSLVTGLVIAVFSLICLFLSESGIRSQEYASFQSNVTAVYQNLQSQSVISHEWLRQIEYNYQLSLSLSENGAPLLFQTFQAAEEDQALFDQVKAAAPAECGIDLDSGASAGSLIRHGEFTLQGEDGTAYHASAGLVPHLGGTLGVTAVHSLNGMNGRISQQRLNFLLAGTAALLLLTVFFWLFTGRMMRPLRENRKKQMQFVASASHELRSPLTVILSNVAAVKSGIMPGDTQFLDTIDSEGKRMSRLITDMLQLASADNKSWSVQPAELELDTLLLQTWEYFESQAAARSLKWEIRLPEETIPRCTCDGERIRQLLSILIDNAFSYTPSGGRVRLSLEAAPTALRISVSDNGPGIPDDQKASVFERFYRADPARKSKAHFGLGLCIAQEIVRLHKGQLLLQDTPGGGATFVVVLPCSRSSVSPRTR